MIRTANGLPGILTSDRQTPLSCPSSELARVRGADALPGCVHDSQRLDHARRRGARADRGGCRERPALPPERAGTRPRRLPAGHRRYVSGAAALAVAVHTWLTVNFAGVVVRGSTVQPWCAID